MQVAPFPIAAQDARDVSPTAKTTDASTLTIPVSWVWVIVVAIVSFALNQAYTLNGVRSDVRSMSDHFEERSRAEKQIDDLNQKYLEQRFAALEAKIESAGLRNANMALAAASQKGK